MELPIVKLHTMFTKGQSTRRHLLQYFANKHSQLWFIGKNFEPDTPELMRNAG